MIKEIRSKSLLRKHRRTDSWFVARYGMNLYRGCQHNCAYCDGRAEGYYVNGEFGEDVEVKINAPELLRRELDPRRKRVPLKKGYIILGGGVGDSYQPAEAKYKLTRQILEILLDQDWPVHILTKSNLVKRDTDIVKKINDKKKVIVSFSLSSVDDDLCSIFEPGVPSATERLATLSFFKEQGIAGGIYLMPVIPFLTDTPEMISTVFKKAIEYKIDFIIFGGMTIKTGRQKDHYFEILKSNFPELIDEYEKIYPGNKWGSATDDYYKNIHRIFGDLAMKYKIPPRIPHRLFKDLISRDDQVPVMLEHIDYLLKLRGMKSNYGYAAYQISKQTAPLVSIKYQLSGIKGIGERIARMVQEILETGTASLYQELMKNYTL